MLSSVSATFRNMPMAMSSLSDEPLTDGVTADMTGYMLGYARSLPHGLNCTLQVSSHGNIQGGHECVHWRLKTVLGLNLQKNKGKKKGGSKGGMSVTLLNRPRQWPRRGIKTILFSGLYEFKTEEFRVASCRRDKQVNGTFFSGIVCQYVQCNFIIRRS